MLIYLINIFCVMEFVHKLHVDSMYTLCALICRIEYHLLPSNWSHLVLLTSNQSLRAQHANRIFDILNKLRALRVVKRTSHSHKYSNIVYISLVLLKERMFKDEPRCLGSDESRTRRLVCGLQLNGHTYVDTDCGGGTWCGGRNRWTTRGDDALIYSCWVLGSDGEWLEWFD